MLQCCSHRSVKISSCKTNEWLDISAKYRLPGTETLKKSISTPSLTTLFSLVEGARAQYLAPFPESRDLTPEDDLYE